MQPTLHAATFWLPKEGNSEDEYEDAFWTPTEPLFPLSPYRCAVADGATETSFSGPWAAALVTAWGAGTLDARAEGDWQEQLPPLQEVWRETVGEKPLPWYAEEKARAGAFSALLGLTLRVDGDAYPYDCTAAGDACLLHVRGDDLLTAFPIAAAAGFNSRPALLSSNTAQNEALARLPVYHHGEWLPGDRFYLATDALACTLLTRHEAGDAPWSTIDILADAAAFRRFVQDAREDKAMRNDDVTLVRLTTGMADDDVPVGAWPGAHALATNEDAPDEQPVVLHGVDRIDAAPTLEERG